MSLCATADVAGEDEQRPPWSQLPPVYLTNVVYWIGNMSRAYINCPPFAYLTWC